VASSLIRMHSWRFLGAMAIAIGLIGLLGASFARAALPDERGWEMVSPVDKNGGQVDPPGGVAGGGVMQAALGGGAVTYDSATSFGSDAAGAPVASQYLGSRVGESWTTQNLTAPTVSGSYDFSDQGVPYQIFSPDLARALLFNGKHCRGEASGCAVSNPPLAGTNAPSGYQDYYLREGGRFEALIEASDIAGLGLDPDTFDVRLAGASPDLKTVVLSTCSRLTADAVDGCGAGKANLYEWTQGGGLTLINGAPGAVLAAPSGAVAKGGSGVYWTDTNDDNLYLFEGTSSTQVDLAAGGGGVFQTASADGSVAFYTKGGHLWRYVEGTSTDLTPGGGVVGVLGTSADGEVAYFQDGSALERWAGAVTAVASGSEAADSSTYPPATGAARVSADGTRLVFVSEEQLTGYDNTDQNTGLPDSEVFLFDATGGGLVCASCNPSSEQPVGPATIPGSVPNGTAPGSTDIYKPRVLSANGRRVFYTSADALSKSDSNANPTTDEGVDDVYEWEAAGEGTCSQAEGCISILSNGSLPEGASFADASADGSDAYILTSASLVHTDPGSQDLYDVRVGGGFVEPIPPIPCEGDACQLLPPVPRNPTLATLVPGAGNPPVDYHKYCRKGYVKRRAICVRRGKHHRRRHGRGHNSKGRNGR